MAADLTQARDGLQNGKAALREQIATGSGENHVLRLREVIAIQLLLQAAELAQQVLLRAWRKFARDLAFGAAQDKGTQPRAQALSGAVVLATIKVPLEVGPIAEGAGCGEGHQAPQVEQTILQRGAGEHESVLGAQLTRGLGNFRVWILNLLAFVENGREPVDLLQLVDAGTELRIIQHQDVGTGTERGEVERVLFTKHFHAKP